MGALRLTALAAVVAAFLIAPAALLADESTELSSAEDAASYAAADEAGEATISTATAGTPVAGDPQEASGDESEGPTEDEGEGPTATASATTAVSIGDFFYRPQDVTVSPGDTVDWTNDGTVPEGHTVTGDGFDSGVLKEGDTYFHTFPNPGSFDYVCTLHPNMRGTVTVTGSTADGGDTAGQGGDDSGTGAVPSTAPTTTPAVASGTGESSGSLASTGLNLILLAEIGGCLLATGLLVSRLRYGWPF